MISGCKEGPQISECILTVYNCENAQKCEIVADCVKPDKTLFTKRGVELDSFYAISAEDRARLMQWAKDRCNAK